MSLPKRVFLAQLAGLPVFDPLGDQVGRVNDIVVAMPTGYAATPTGYAATPTTPRVIGLVVEVAARNELLRREGVHSAREFHARLARALGVPDPTTTLQPPPMNEGNE